MIGSKDRICIATVYRIILALVACTILQGQGLS